MTKRVRGFDYRIQQEVEKTVAEWKEELRLLLARGGHRRVDSGETFGHGTDGLIAFEIYANIQVKEK